MEPSVNPYRPPDIERVRLPWWRRLSDFLFHPEAHFSHASYDRFLNGEMIMREGIGFVVDPANHNDLFVVSAGRVGDDQREKLVRQEAQRVKSHLIEVYPKFAQELDRRELVIVLVEQYDHCREAILESASKQ